ncbi:MAG: hypothetical protein ACKV2T_16605 [Kofleriaceae bacterium]
MTRLSAALALLALLSPTAIAEPCAPRVELAGDRDAIARVAVELKALGVVLGSIEPASRSCSVNAMVALEGEGLAVAVHNSSRRSEGRVVGDARVAAAWIDSWLRDEIEVSSWAIAALPLAAPSTHTAMQSTPMSASASGAPEVVPAPSPSLFERVGLSFVVERSWTDDDTEWNGFDIAGCMRIGPTCLGGRIRAGFQDDLAYLSSTADRSDIVALATASIPLTAGQVSIAPEIGIGVGRMRTQRVEACTAGVQPPMPSPGCSDPMDPTCMMNPDDPVTGGGTACIDAEGTPTNELYVGDGYDKSTYLPRVALAMRLSFPIVRHVWLDAVASYTLTLFAPRVVFEDPNTMMDSIAMPPEPERGYQLGVGIRVGIP